MLYIIIYNYKNSHQTNINELLDRYEITEYKIIPIDKCCIYSICRMMDIYGILDMDYVLLINGKYKLIIDNPLLENVKKIIDSNENIDVISKYYFIDYICMRYKCLKHIQQDFNEINVEIMKNQLNDNNVIYLPTVGIDINLNPHISHCIYTIC